MEEQRKTGMGNHITMKLPFFCKGNFVCLWVDWDFFIEINVVHIEKLNQPVAKIPLLSVP